MTNGYLYKCEDCFIRLFGGEDNCYFNLPRRWDGLDFHATLNNLYDDYQKAINGLGIVSDEINGLYGISVSAVCKSILNAVQYIFDGRPSAALDAFNVAYYALIKHPLVAYDDKTPLTNLPMLYRVRAVDEDRSYTREEIFHIPFSKRRFVGPSRYSIPGYPSLYLASSVGQAIRETRLRLSDKSIVAGYRFAPNQNLQILDMGMKPCVVLKVLLNEYPAWEEEDEAAMPSFIRFDGDYCARYFLWYPIIAACSFMRVSRTDPFAPEYIVPQLLMQALRQSKQPFEDEILFGIRYFSCASIRISNSGFNYVFPTHYDGSNSPFCPKLKKAFVLTEPVAVSDFDGYPDLEEFLNNAPLSKIE